MSKERSAGYSSFDESESKPSQHEKQIRKLFKRAGWENSDTPEARRQTIRDEFDNLFEEALFEKNSPYTIEESYSKDKKFLNTAITKDKKTIAVKSMLNVQQIDGQPQTAYSVVRDTGRLRRDLVFQLVEYPAVGGLNAPSELNIGYYAGKGQAKHIISDED